MTCSSSPSPAQLSNANFDWLMTHRPVPYKADPKIVVLDIDEASLAALAPQFGRWPWPRQVLADVGSRLEAAHAQAVLFDILFSDPDLANKGGDEAFDRYVMASKSSFYPIVRLSPTERSGKQDSGIDAEFRRTGFGSGRPGRPLAHTPSRCCPPSSTASTRARASGPTISSRMGTTSYAGTTTTRRWTVTAFPHCLTAWRNCCIGRSSSRSPLPHQLAAWRYALCDHQLRAGL